MMDLRPVGYVIGLLVAILGATMLLPMLADIIEGRGEWNVFFESGVITILTGEAANRPRLYSRSLDPGELDNRADEHPIVVSFLKSLGSLHLSSATRLRTSEAEIDPELERNLEALGYL